MHRDRRGFTLLEILLVVAAIAILAGIVIVAINPAKQLGETRDAQRRSDVNALTSAIVQYVIKGNAYPAVNEGTTCDLYLPDNDNYGVCVTDESCGGIPLDDLVPDFIASIPIDPAASADDGFSGYTVFRLASGRVRVCAPLTEEDEEMISSTR